MKQIWSGVLVAFSLYSAIPVPQVKWERETMRWALVCLPLVGVVIGIIEWLWYCFCKAYHAVALFYAGIAALIPLLISGGIHLDGLCDTCDALCSYGEQEKKLQILKDPHIGAFGVIWLAAFLLAETVCFAQLYETPVLLSLIYFGFALARTVGGRKIVSLPCAKDSGLAHIFATNSDKKITARLLLIENVCLLILCAAACPKKYIWALIVIFGLLYGWARFHSRLCKKAFGGITGDLAGFFISTSELLFLISAAIGGLVLVS